MKGTAQYSKRKGPSKSSNKETMEYKGNGI
jgi:hypothetical protein